MDQKKDINAHIATTGRDGSLQHERSAKREHEWQYIYRRSDRESMEEDLAAQIEQLREQLARNQEKQEAEIARIRALADAEIEQLRRERDAANQTIKRAKDPNPISRPTAKRVLKLVSDACMSLVRVVGGWLLSLGRKTRRFKKLKEIWELLLADDWCLSDVFPSEHKVCYSAPGTAPRVEDAPKPQKPDVKNVVKAGQPPGVSMEHLAAEWRMFPSARPAIKELLFKVGLSPDLLGQA